MSGILAAHIMMIVALFNCREATKGVEGERQTQRLWTPTLDPPAALAWLSVVLVGVKRPYSAGSVARASNCFECEDLRLVQVCSALFLVHADHAF